MKNTKYLLAGIFSVFASVNADESGSLRGVLESDSHLYLPNGQGLWSCLENPDILLSIDQINDNYCDCPDGSDEPGTSACFNGVFHCPNKGHIPGKLPSNRVDDGVCDYDICCDGSDEAGLSEVLGKTLCPNRCEEIHREYSKIQRQKAAQQASGAKARGKLIEDAKIARENLNNEIASSDDRLLQERTRLIGLEKELELAKEDAAKQRAEDLRYSVLIEESKLELAAIQDEVSQLLNVISTLDKEIKQLDESFENLKNNYNPNFNDPAVKGAIREWENFKTSQEDPDVAAILARSNSAIEVSEKLDQLKAEIDRLLRAQKETKLSAAWKKILTTKWARKTKFYIDVLRVWLVENGLLADTVYQHDTTSPDSTPAVVEAQNKVSETESTIEQLSSFVDSSIKDLDADYGPDEVLRALKGSCVSRDMGDYVYEYCYYGEASQKENGRSTSLGKQLNLELIDDKIILKYENGQKCWNGPNRRCTVELSCGPEHDILAVTEPEKCDYYFKVLSPVACTPDNSSGGDPVVLAPDRDAL